MRDSGVVIAVNLFFLSCFAAWLTHVVWIISMLLLPTIPTGHIVIGVLGAFMPPIGVIHGFMIWFGIGW